MERTKPPTNERLTLSLEAFRSDAHLQVNKRLLKIFGLELAVYIANLCDKLQYFMANNKLEDGGFFLTYEQQMEQTGMSEHQLRKCKKKLKELDILTTERRHIPSKEFYFLNMEELVNQTLRASPLKFRGLDVKNLEGKPTQKCQGYNETKCNETKGKDIDPKGSYGSENHEDQIIPSNDASFILDYWGSLSNKTVKHTPSSKTYRQACLMIDRLLQGFPIFPKPTQKTFPHKNLSNFCTKHGVDPSILHKQWSLEEIKSVLSLIERELPDDQKHSLENVLWNGFAKGGGFSPFLYKADQKQVPEDYLVMADKLAAAIGVPLTEGKRIDWAKNFQLLHSENGKTEEHIHEVLDWYMQNYDYSKVRSVSDAQEFCDYFNKIRKSMKIKEEDRGNSDNKKSSQGFRNKDAMDHDPKYPAHKVINNNKN